MLCFLFLTVLGEPTNVPLPLLRITSESGKLKKMKTSSSQSLEKLQTAKCRLESRSNTSSLNLKIQKLRHDKGGRKQKEYFVNPRLPKTAGTAYLIAKMKEEEKRRRSESPPPSVIDAEIVVC